LTEFQNSMLIIYICVGQFTTPKFKCLRSAYRKTPPDQFAAAKSFRTLKVESIEESRRNIMPGSG
jgi:hypothetical protein